MSSSGGGFTSHNPDEKIIVDGKTIFFDKTYGKEIKYIIDFICDKYNRLVESLNGLEYDKKKFDSFNYYYNSLVIENDKVVKSILFDLENKSRQYINFIRSIYFDLFYHFRSLSLGDSSIFNSNNYYLDWLYDSLLKLKNLSKIEIFSNIKSGNIVIIGGNGAGKSTFVSYIKNIYSDDMVIIPAQKILMFDSSINNLSVTSKKDIDMLYHENVINGLQDKSIYIPSNSIVSAFSKVIVAIVNTTIDEQKKSYEDGIKIDTLFCKLTRIWNRLIPNIELDFDIINRTIYPIDSNGNSYSLNAMSDGEKALLYYICNILLADEYSYIVVDEPETHLNPSIYKKLWNILEEEKPNCQFIYISHDIEFVRSRNNINLVWMKNYIYKDTWIFELLEKGNYIPIDVLLEVYGSKNKILFCEGEKHSLDYEIYSSLFDNYTVIPVGGCGEVIKYTESFNKQSQLHNNEAIGIVDFDNRDEKQIKFLHKKKVYETKYNEIEMLLCDELVIDNVLSNYPDEEREERIDKFKRNFFKTIDSKKDIIARSYVSNRIIQYTNNYVVEGSTLNDIKNSFNKIISGINIDDEYSDYLNRLQSEIDNNNYENLLRYCNLKKEIVYGLGNKYLTNDYELLAVTAVKKQLKDEIKNKYFDFIL